MYMDYKIRMIGQNGVRCGNVNLHLLTRYLYILVLNPDETKLFDIPAVEEVVLHGLLNHEIPETSHSGNKNPGGSNDVTPKSSVTQISSKTASSPVPGKDSQARVSL
nr:uncharacterized protein LOC109150871 isoform X1 [Ipomoea trifida]